ncbi:hypothetical protein R6Q57_007262 [Mikania cordata]
MDQTADPKLGFIQFPQRFSSINKNDIYASEFKPETQILSLGGMDGLLGPSFMGTGGFFKRHVLSMDSRLQIGFRYGTITEDTYTSFRLHCEGWKSVLCNPKRAAFLGGSENGFYLHMFLFLGAYGKDFLDFVVFAGGPALRWWNHQRMWMMWGLSSYPFALLEWSLKSLGLSTFGFNVSSKVVDEEQSTLYEQGVFEFGVESVLFFPVSVASLINLMSFVKGVMSVVTNNGTLDEFFVQMFISGFVVLNSWPIYEAMVLRKDRGKMPINITLASATIAMAICFFSSLFFRV